MLPHSHFESLHARGLSACTAVAMALTLCSVPTVPVHADELLVGFGATPDLTAARQQTFPILKI